MLQNIGTETAHLFSDPPIQDQAASRFPLPEQQAAPDLPLIEVARQCYNQSLDPVVLSKYKDMEKWEIEHLMKWDTRGINHYKTRHFAMPAVEAAGLLSWTPRHSDTGIKCHDVLEIPNYFLAKRVPERSTKIARELQGNDVHLLVS
ncbi:predicted protein [Coccidioides posadasii str. Silveira]|uniref:Predicted protein n=1 Tax=Coccidioides posadasii (strain RMSCC 757 / Silveira) TaxID=443226 RepID=E9D501_COCPS|nr:predicted protein [Coccidioides posadasii str. Silveira]